MMTTVPFLVWSFSSLLQPSRAEPLTIISAMCTGVALALVIYIIWTHRLFTRTPAAQLTAIFQAQERRGPSLLARSLGIDNTESWSLSAALTALIGSVAAAVYSGQHTGWLLAIIVVFTAVAAWLTVAYAYALRYARVESVTRTFEFDHGEEPVFADFVAMALMISAAGASSVARANTREGMRAMRSHTLIAFAFNALVIAMVVSLITSFAQT